MARLTTQAIHARLVADPDVTCDAEVLERALREFEATHDRTKLMTHWIALVGRRKMQEVVRSIVYAPSPDVAIVGVRTLEQRNREGFANAIVID